MNFRVGIYSKIVWCCGTIGCILAVANGACAGEPRVASLTLATKISAPPIPDLSSTAELSTAAELNRSEAESAASLPTNPLIPDLASEKQTVHAKPWIISSTRLPAPEAPKPVVAAKPPELPEPVLPPSQYDFRNPALLAATPKKEEPAIPASAASGTIAASLGPSGKAIPRAISRIAATPKTGRTTVPSESKLASVEVVTEESATLSKGSSTLDPAPVATASTPTDHVITTAIAPPNAASLPAAPEAWAVATVEEPKTNEPAAAVQFAPTPTPLPTGNIVAMAPPAVAEPIAAVVADVEPRAIDSAPESSNVAKLARLASSPARHAAAGPESAAQAVTKSEPIGMRPSRLSDMSADSDVKDPAPVVVSKPVVTDTTESQGEVAAKPIATPAPVSVAATDTKTPTSITDNAVTPVSATTSANDSTELASNVELAAAVATLRGKSTPTVVNASAVTSTTTDESKNIQQVGCSSCGQGEPLPRVGDSSIWSSSMMDDAGGCMSCGAGRGPCTPGQIPCAECDVHTPLGRMMAELYHCICCPDPCYEPRWIPLANAALTVDSVRPKTHQTLRWDFMNGLRTPDRAEYYFGRYSAYVGDGPLPPTPPPTTPPFVDTSVEFNELTSITEAGLAKFAVFVEVPYRSIDPNVSNSAAGFSDVKVGTKSVIFDCELLQIAMQFKTYIPSGVSFQGLGTGHATLEPSVLFAMKLHPDVYLQGQVAEWIPFSADASQAGAILRVNASLNALLWCLNRDVQLIGTLEANTWSFQDGQYINPYLDPANPATYAINASGQTYGWMGPGARLSICNRVDMGMATMFGFGERSWSDFGLRMEMRTLF